MFDFLKQKRDEQAPDVKTIRHRIVLFIKEQLQRWEGGEGQHIKGIQLFLSPSDAEKQLYEAAVYVMEGDRFKEEEVQRLADDYDMALPLGWRLDIQFVESLPSEAATARDMPVALHIITNKKPVIHKGATAQLTVRKGEAEQPVYTITSQSGKVCIGRDRETQMANGFLRINTIAFPADSSQEGNKYISRNHAHISWNAEAGSFFLYADEGGIPPRNKVKVQTADGALVKLQSTQIGHPLREGDQIILGETALLEFNYTSE